MFKLQNYQTILDYGSLIVYETNVSDISDVSSGLFEYELSDKTNLECFLKKTKEKPLLLFCKTPLTGIFSLGNMDEKILYDKSIKYNFFIAPVSNDEKISINGKGCIATMAYPNVLNFRLNDTYIVDFLMLQCAKNIDGIKINPYASDLSCSNINNSTKRYIVLKSNFK